MPLSVAHEKSRPDDMSDIEWLVAMEEIRQLKARRDRYVDAHDWDAYAALHAPDHRSHHAPDPTVDLAPEPWTSVEQMMENIRRHMPDSLHSVHHCYDAEIVFETATKARTIWAMTGATVSKDAAGDPEWSISYGYYFETCEKRDGRWLYTSRRWQRHFGVRSKDAAATEVMFPHQPLKGADAFDSFE